MLELRLAHHIVTEVARWSAGVLVPPSARPAIQRAPPPCQRARYTRRLTGSELTSRSMSLSGRSSPGRTEPNNEMRRMWWRAQKSSMCPARCWLQAPGDSFTSPPSSTRRWYRPERRAAQDRADARSDVWRARRDSNSRPSGPQPDALSTELRAPERLAEREGFEPSEQVTPLTGLANRRTRPLCDLSSSAGRW